MRIIKQLCVLGVFVSVLHAGKVNRHSGRFVADDTPRAGASKRGHLRKLRTPWWQAHVPSTPLRSLEAAYTEGKRFTHALERDLSMSEREAFARIDAGACDTLTARKEAVARWWAIFITQIPRSDLKGFAEHEVFRELQRLWTKHKHDLSTMSWIAPGDGVLHLPRAEFDAMSSRINAWYERLRREASAGDAEG